jgi:hypothetical protein
MKLEAVLITLGLPQGVSSTLSSFLSHNICSVGSALPWTLLLTPDATGESPFTESKDKQYVCHGHDTIF